MEKVLNKGKLLIVANVDWFFISHRLVIANAALKEGWEVYVATEDTGRADEIRKCGIEFIDFKFSRSGTNPFAELATVLKFYNLYKKVKPDVVHHVTLKPVTYGSIAAKILKVKGVVNAIGGLGYSFTGERSGAVQKIMTSMMRWGFRRNSLTVIFQNRDDEKILRDKGVIYSKNDIQLIKGAGVDLEEYSQAEFPPFDKIKILLSARMLWDKGIKELKEASDILREKYATKIQFVLAGMADEGNKAGVPTSYLQKWEDGDYVKWLGYQKYMVDVYKDAHIVVLPSYREGMPKTLLEACAVGRPIITADAIGCRECVDEGINGFKVPVYAVKELAEAIEKLINNSHLIIEMGKASRKKAEVEFDVRNVVDRHLEIYKAFLEVE